MGDQSNRPFQRLLRADFTDVDAMCAAVRSWDLDFEPLSPSPQQGQIGHIAQSAAGGVMFSHARFSASLDQRGAPPPGAVTFVLLEDSMRRLWWRGHDVDSQTLLAFPVGSELHSLSGSDFNIHTVSVPLDFCERVCEARKIRQPAKETPQETFRPPRRMGAALRRAVRLFQGSAATPTATDAKSIAETLVSYWMQAGTETNAKRPSGRARELAVRRTLELLERSDWADLTMSELCAQAGVSERTLQFAFRERFGLTPAAFFKARRLAAVRSELKRRGEDWATVGDVAAEFGFWHSGQFATDYKRAFGELPSATLYRSMSEKVAFGATLRPA